MQPITQEWVDKAEGDWGSLEREGLVQVSPNNDLICYLAQQCAAKYLKARLQEANIVFPKTHDLEDLLDLALSVESQWQTLRQNLQRLSAYAVHYRYPGKNAARIDSLEAIKLCRGVRETIRLSFGLPI